MRMTADVLEASKKSSVSLDDLATEVVRVISFPVKHSKIPSPGKENFMRIGFSLLRHFQGNEALPVYGQLVSSLVGFLLFNLPGLLKEDALDMASGLTAEVSLKWLLAQFSGSQVEAIISSVEPPLVFKVIRACLKNGLRSPADTGAVNCLSLELVNLLVRLSGNSASRFSSLILPREIFEMITSHSRFETLFVETVSGGGGSTRLYPKQQEAVIELMISCINASDAEIVVSQSIWKTILCSFTAGLGRLDKLIRRLVLVCEDGSQPFSDEIRWTGHNSLNRLNYASSRWEWLVEALDHSRIRATISSFPSSDTFDADVFFADSWTFGRGINKSDEKENSDVAGEPTDVPIRTTEKLQSTGGEHRRTTPACSKDYRYSPAVLLPIVLGALESETNSENGTVKLSSNTENGRQNVPEIPSGMTHSGASTETVQRLCEKGIVSLCLVALSSASEEIRAYAICVLGIVLRTAGTIEARESSTWRNRSQLVMILNSVQRSLVILKACSHEYGGCSNSVSVPKLPPLVSLFLARASLVLSRPDDALYVPMNRYFLKTESDHGAFQDTNRLPGFMSLFCSANDDPGQSRTERLWALQLLRDGLVDSTCYRLAASCHAPELMLSSFENVRLSRLAGEAKAVEYCLLQDALKVMVANGGCAAHSHLLGRMGMLSWLRSYCTSRSLEEAFPTSETARSFCKLVSSMIQVARSTPKLRCQISREEALGLIQPLLSLSLGKFPSTDHVNDSFFHDALEALDSIGRFLTTFCDEDSLLPHNEIHPLGLSMEASIQVMRLATRDDDDDVHEFRKRTLSVLCSLPVSLVKCSACLDDESVVDLCTFLLLSLEYCLATDSATDGPLMELVMKRMRLLVDYYNGCFAPDSTTIDPILQRLLLIRCKLCVACDETLLSLWLQFMKRLSQYYNGDNKFLRFAFEQL
jgi:hypothetical protein